MKGSISNFNMAKKKKSGAFAHLVATVITIEWAHPRAKTVIIRSPIRIGKVEDLIIQP